MLTVLLLIVSFLFFNSTSSSSGNSMSPDEGFDNYGDLCWEDETARLDNFAITLQQNPRFVGHIIVYAGRQSCEGEARYRANRAKKWVVSRGVKPDRIIVRDGGYLTDVTTYLQPWPQDKPPYAQDFPRLTPAEVTVFRHCRNRIFRPRKCPTTSDR